MQSERLTFRHFVYADAPVLADLVNDIDIARWIGSMPHPYTRAMAEAYLAHVVPSDPDTYAIEYNGDLIGAIGIDKMLGFWLARSHWGHGLMSESCVLMIDTHFAKGATGLRSAYHMGNTASKRVHDKLGFKVSGTSQVRSLALGRDVTRQDLVLTAADWQARP